MWINPGTVHWVQATVSGKDCVLCTLPFVPCTLPFVPCTLPLRTHVPLPLVPLSLYTCIHFLYLAFRAYVTILHGTVVQLLPTSSGWLGKGTFGTKSKVSDGQMLCYYDNPYRSADVRSIVPMVHLSWNLARRVRCTDRNLIPLLRYALSDYKC